MKADQWRRSVDGTNEEVGGEVGEMMGTNDGSVSGANGGVGGEIEDVGGEVGGMMGTNDRSVSGANGGVGGEIVGVIRRKSWWNR
jgi:hypothetical protein